MNFSVVFRKLAFDPEQARDANGRWTAVSVGSEGYAVEGIRSQDRGGKTVQVSAGVRPERFKTRQQAEAFATKLNDAVRDWEKTLPVKTKSLETGLVRSATGTGILVL